METDKKGRKPGSRGGGKTDLWRKLHDIKNENAALKRSLAAKEKTIKNIKDLGKDKMKTLTDLQKSHEVEMQKLQNEKKRLEKDNNRLESEIEVKRAAKEEITVKQSQEDESQIERLKKSIEDEEKEMKLMVDEGKKTELAIEMTNKIVQEYESELNDANEELESAESNLNQLNEVNEERKGHYNHLVQEKNDLCDAMEAIQSRIDLITKEIQEKCLYTFMDEFDRKMRELQKLKIELECQNTQVDREFSIWRLEANARLNEKSNEIDAATERIELLQARKKKKLKKPGCFRRMFRRLFRGSENNFPDAGTSV